MEALSYDPSIRHFDKRNGYPGQTDWMVESGRVPTYASSDRSNVRTALSISRSVPRSSSIRRTA